MTNPLNPIVLSTKLWEATRILRRQLSAMFVFGFTDYEAMLHGGGVGSISAIAWLVLAGISTLVVAIFCVLWVAKVFYFVDAHRWSFITVLALLAGVIAEWQYYTTAFDGSTMAAVWSCIGVALLLSTTTYVGYRVSIAGRYPPVDAND